MWAFQQLCDKRDDFDFHIVNFPYISSNILDSPGYGVYISQETQELRSSYGSFIDRGKLLTNKLFIKVIRLKSWRYNFEIFMVDTMILYNITILLVHKFM